MCDECKERLDTFATVMRKMQSEVYDAKVSSEAANTKIEGLAKLLEQYHKEDQRDRVTMWKVIQELNEFKASWKGIVIGATVVITSIWSVVIVAINWFKGAGHG